MDEILIILLLILMNGIFSMSEIAVISARKSKLQAEAAKGSKSAQRALKLQENPDNFLSSVQIGITLIGILTGIFSGNKIASSLKDVFLEWGVSSSFAGGLAQALIVIIVTYLTIVLGELVPKRIALSASENVSKTVSGFMAFISKIAYPFVWLLAKSTGFFVKILGIKSTDNKVTEEEIKSIIQEGTDEGEVSPMEQDIVESVFKLGDLSVSSIMTPRCDIVYLSTDMDDRQVRETIVNQLHEEYPIISGDIDHVVGIIRLKDFVTSVSQIISDCQTHGTKTEDALKFDLKTIIKEPVYFHESMNVYKVLEEMKAKKISRALVCDEFGTLSGIITLRDILEALVGNVDDDIEEEPDIVPRKDGSGWLVDGMCSIYDFLRYFDCEDTMQDYEYTTVAGLVFDVLERMPETGDVMEWNKFKFEIVDMDGPKVDRLLVTLIPDSTEED